jgi:hypothetical protein
MTGLMQIGGRLGSLGRLASYETEASDEFRSLIINNESGGTVTNARIEVGLPFAPNDIADTGRVIEVVLSGATSGTIQANLSQRSKGWRTSHLSFGALNFVVPSLANGVTNVSVSEKSGTEPASPDDSARLALLDDIRVEITNLKRKIANGDAGTSVGTTWVAQWDDAAAVVRQRRSGTASSAWECCVPFEESAVDHESLVARFIATVWSDDTIHLKVQVLNSRGDKGHPYVRHNSWAYTATIKKGALTVASSTHTGGNNQLGHSHHWIGETDTEGYGHFILDDELVDNQEEVWVEHDPAELAATQIIPPVDVANASDWTAGSTVTGYVPNGARAEGSGYSIATIGDAGSVDRDHNFLLPNPFADFVKDPTRAKWWKLQCWAMSMGSMPQHVTDPNKHGPVYILNQSVYTKPTGYSTLDFKELFLPVNDLAAGQQMVSWRSSPAGAATSSRVSEGGTDWADQNSCPIDNTHWFGCAPWWYLISGSVWAQVAAEDELILCLAGNDYRHKTIVSNSTTYYQVLLTYNQERGPAQYLRNIAQIPIVWAEDSTTKQYANDIITNFKNAAQSTFTHDGVNGFGSSVQPTQSKTLHWQKLVALNETAVAPWMISFGAVNAAYLKLVGADLSEIPIADEYVKWMIDYVLELRGYAGSYWVTWKDVSAGGASSIIEDWDEVKISVNGAPTSIYTDYDDAGWVTPSDRATQDTWVEDDATYTATANPAYANLTRAAIEVAVAAGVTNADDAYAECQTFDGNSPITLAWRESYPGYMYNASHVFVAET